MTDVLEITTLRPAPRLSDANTIDESDVDRQMSGVLQHVDGVRS